MLINMVEKKKNCTEVNFVLLCLIGKGKRGAVYWRVAIYTSEYNLHVTRPVGECFKKLLSNHAFRSEIAYGLGELIIRQV